jgi:hypothetical protein
MDVMTATTILAGTILTGISICLAVIVILVVNNLLHKYWKPVTWRMLPEYQERRFATEEELDKINKIVPELSKVAPTKTK